MMHNYYTTISYKQALCNLAQYEHFTGTGQRINILNLSMADSSATDHLDAHLEAVDQTSYSIPADALEHPEASWQDLGLGKAQP